MVNQRADELRVRAGPSPIEEQNAFKQKGKKTGAVLSGKPDIVATRGADAARRRLQVRRAEGQGLLAGRDLPRDAAAHPRRSAPDGAWSASCATATGAVTIQPEEMTPDVRARISAQLLETGGLVPPAKVPSERECAFCDIGRADCPERLELAAAAATTTDLF
jgi:hypothetical protein